MKEFINYIITNPQKKRQFLWIFSITTIIMLGSIFNEAWFVGVPLFVIVNGMNIFGDWMNFKKYWT